MNQRLKSLSLTVVKFGLPIGILWYLVANITPEQWDVLRNSEKHYGYLVLALALGLVATCISYVRWYLLVRSHHIPLTLIEGIRLGTIGFLLNFVSVGAVGGDVFKAYFLARRSPGKRIEVFATVLVDRVVGLYGLLLVASAALFVIGDAIGGADLVMIRQFVYALTIIGALFMIAIVLGGPVIDRTVEQLGRLPLVGGFVHRVADPLRAFRDHTITFMITILMAVVVHVMIAVAIFFVASGLYRNHPTLGEHLVIVPIANAIAGLPISIAGIGVFEGVLDKLYQVVPAVPSAASGTVIGMVYEIVKMIIAAMGIVYYWTSGKEVRDSIRDASEESTSENV